mmetsp:Transcript_7156/g.25530  ORF Transcript_7156/g.25530 Transcript_7156/m.25530 type:complete len:212 (-) Transcript_7156:685-1320(-)
MAEKPPPVVMPPPVLDEQATSVVPASGPCVAPTAVTCGAVAGYDGLKPQAPGLPRAAAPATPSSPEATKTVMPRAPSLAISSSKDLACGADVSDSGEPYEMECTSGGSEAAATACAHSRKDSVPGMLQNVVCVSCAMAVICCTSSSASMQLFGLAEQLDGSLGPITLEIFCLGSEYFWSKAARSLGSYDWPMVSNRACDALVVDTVLLSMP